MFGAQSRYRHPPSAVWTASAHSATTTFPSAWRTPLQLCAGTMGHGIAHVCAVMGAEVRIYDALQGAAKGAVERIRKNLDKGVELGKVTAEARDAAIARVRPF